MSVAKGLWEEPSRDWRLHHIYSVVKQYGMAIFPFSAQKLRKRYEENKELGGSGLGIVKMNMESLQTNTLVIYISFYLIILHSSNNVIPKKVYHWYCLFN